MEQVRQLLRGEPLVLRGIVVAVLAAVGWKVAPDQVDAAITIVAPLVLALIARHKVTPTENPAVPTTIAVKADEAETPAEQPKVQLPPILTITGQRR